MLVIEAKRLSKRFARSDGFALRELDLAVEGGEIFGLLGPNGAGKTTTLHLLLDFIHPSAGEALLFGRPASDPRNRARIGYLPESLSLHAYYRGADLLEFYGALLGMSPDVRAERAATLIRLLGLEDVARRRVSTYSKGTLQRLGFAQALLNEPDLLILDEPTSSLDPLARRQFSETLRELKSRGKTILVSSHLLSEVEAICDRVAILKQGELVRLGSLDELLATSSVQLQVRHVPAAVVDRLISLGAEVEFASSRVTIRCRNRAVRDAVVAVLDAEGITIERTEAEMRSLEELFVETVGA
jgi:ABC-2 type transport system ATP-binding protein